MVNKCNQRLAIVYRVDTNNLSIPLYSRSSEYSDHSKK